MPYRGGVIGSGNSQSNVYSNSRSYSNNIDKITNGFGRIDESVGKTLFSLEETLMMEQIAKAQGRSYKDVVNGVIPRRGNGVIGGGNPQSNVVPLENRNVSEVMENVTRRNENYSDERQSHSFNAPIDVNIHGDIMLKTDAGQSFDISKMIQGDNMLIRNISQLISKQMSVAINGGRGKHTLAIGSV